MTEIRHIVFDIGRVLIQWDPELPYHRLFPDAEERRRFLAEVCTSAWNHEQDRGRSWADAEAVLIAEHPQHEAAIRFWRANWHEMVPGDIPESVAILSTLIAGGHDVTALTNFATDTFEEAVARFPFLATFRGVTVSGRVGLCKPDRAIYHHHAAAYGLDPAATLFFDDTLPNVLAAREAGWNAELFLDPAGMRADLARYGVLPG
ncbi:HAD family hydrolase [Prosthecomicrobium pneumaticum]|uniref:FMN phosphatase YigB (HAD superfamily) n=1 Tax=Prosthecomicrobium pneumaticum TaxID=81895 RepID=A0A7W9L3B5_9HYPH|nr:HAD family phosphatase [Prosthecomicrobium pneumaticum]MBB5754388.1 FMN phosphatase YigB (HAD superfamily) [Prosthecomicrobium pneumaticum]